MREWLGLQVTFKGLQTTRPANDNQAAPFSKGEKDLSRGVTRAHLTSFKQDLNGEKNKTRLTEISLGRCAKQVLQSAL